MYLCKTDVITLVLGEMILYHGSQNVIEKPEWGAGRKDNDYGRGFYCTGSLDLAREWACVDMGVDGFANEYEIDTAGLEIVDLCSDEYHILNWLAVLLENRIVENLGPLQQAGRDYIIANFLPDYKNADIVKGYRADDSYFSFARAFLAGSISLSQLNRAMHLGKLGIQTVLMSKKAFDRLEYRIFTPCASLIWNQKRRCRDAAARQDFMQMHQEKPAKDEIYLIDIIRQEWRNDDERLR